MGRLSNLFCWIFASHGVGISYGFQETSPAATMQLNQGGASEWPAPVKLDHGNALEFLKPVTGGELKASDIVKQKMKTAGKLAKGRWEASRDVAAKIGLVKPAAAGFLPERFPKWILLAYIALGSLLLVGIYCVMAYSPEVGEKEFDVADSTLKLSTSDSWECPWSTESGDDLKTGKLSGQMLGAFERHHRGDHQVEWFQYFAMAFWVILLSICCASVRFVCHFGIPRDCQENTTIVEFVKANHMLLGYGFVLGICTGLPSRSRFFYIFSFHWGKRGKPRGVPFLMIFFGSAIGWSFLDLFPSLSTFSLNDSSSFEGLHVFLLVTLIAGISLLTIWHFCHAYHVSSRQGFWAYAASRFVVFLLFSAYFVGASDLSSVSFHLHHYLVGFFFAFLAEFNEPLSLILLASGSGVMAQGIAAYGADQIVSGGEFIAPHF